MASLKNSTRGRLILNKQNVIRNVREKIFGFRPFDIAAVSDYMQHENCNPMLTVKGVFTVSVDKRIAEDKQCLKKIELAICKYCYRLPPSFTRNSNKICGSFVIKSRITCNSSENITIFIILDWSKNKRIIEISTLHKKWSSPLRISSVNVTKSAGNCGFSHIYWRNP